MENNKSNILLLSEESLRQISNPDHIRYVLGIDIPLNESTTEYGEDLLNEIVEKQLILENVLNKLKDYLKDKYNTFVDTVKSPFDVFILIKNLITNPEALKAVYGTYRSKVDNYKKTFEETLLQLTNGLEDIAEKFTKIPEEEFQTVGTTMQIEIDGYKNLVGKIKNYFDGVVNYINKEVGKDWLGLIKSIVINGVLGFVIDKVKSFISKFTKIIDWTKPKETIKKLRDNEMKSRLDSGLDSNIARVFESLKGITSTNLDSVQGFFKDIMSGKNWLWKYIVKFLSKIAKEVKSTIKKVGNIDLTHYGRMERDLKKIQDSYLRRLINNLLIVEMNKHKNDNIYNKNIIMSKNIKETVKKNLNTLLETKGFEEMEVAFGVKEKSDNLSDAEKKQFGEWETIQDKESGLVNLGDASVQPALNKVNKETKKDADEYYKEVAKKMVGFQETSEAEPSQIGEAIEIPKVNREDDQTEPDEVYSTEALGPGMLALRYDNEGTPVHDKFQERMEDMNGDDLTYKKLKAYSEKYLKHKYEKPDEYHYSPKVRVTDKPINENYSDVIKENIFKVKGQIKSKEQIINLVDKLPERVKIDETVFAVTDGENYYRLIWEGSEDGEAVITHEKNVNIVNENINKMKHLWDFKSSENLNKKPSVKENEDVFFKMMNKVRGK